MDKQVFILLGVGLLVMASILSWVTYQKDQDRKAYYACLQLSEKLIEQQKQPDKGVQIVSLPYCRN